MAFDQSVCLTFCSVPFNGLHTLLKESSIRFLRLILDTWFVPKKFEKIFI